MAMALSLQFALARGNTVVTGGGQGTFNADLDGDKDIDGSYFGVGIVFRGDSAEGHFVCGMWGNTDILGLPLMAVEGQVSNASIIDQEEKKDKKERVTFKGVGTVDLGREGEFFTDVPFEVTMQAGGPGEGTLQLTVIGAFDGVAGDTIPGHGNYDLPIERVSSGHIKIHRR